MSGKAALVSSAEGDLADTEAVFSALAHPTRRHILLVLQFRGGEVSAGDIAKRFACTWPTTTRHLRVLEDAGFLHPLMSMQSACQPEFLSRLRKFSIVLFLLNNFRQ